MDEQRTDFVPLAPVQLVKPNGMVRPFGLGATSDALRGAAMLAAQSAAASGDLIEVFGNATPNALLGKNGVNWRFGAVTVTNATTSVWGDGGSATAFSIDGSARFVGTSKSVLDFSHASSSIRVAARSLAASGTGFVPVQLANGATVFLDIAEYMDSGYDVFLGVGNAYWRCPRITAVDNVFEIDGTMYGGGQFIRSTSDVFNGGGITGRIEADWIESTGAAVIRDISSPNLTVRAATLKGGSGSDHVIHLETGTGVVIEDSTIVAGAAGNSAVVVESTTGLVLKNCWLKSGASATYGIRDFGGGGGVTVIGTLFSNKPVQPEITLSGGVLEINGVATRFGATQLTSAGLALLDDASAAAQRVSLGVEKRIVTLYPFAPTADVETGDGKATFRVPTALNGGVITATHAMVNTAGTTGDTTIQIARVRSGTPADVLGSDPMDINSGETGSDTGDPGTIDTANDELQTGDIIRIDVDAVSTTKPKGLQVTIEVTL